MQPAEDLIHQTKMKTWTIKCIFMVFLVTRTHGGRVVGGRLEVSDSLNTISHGSTHKNLGDDSVKIMVKVIKMPQLKFSERLTIYQDVWDRMIYQTSSGVMKDQETEILKKKLWVPSQKTQRNLEKKLKSKKNLLLKLHAMNQRQYDKYKKSGFRKKKAYPKTYLKPKITYKKETVPRKVLKETQKGIKENQKLLGKTKIFTETKSLNKMEEIFVQEEIKHILPNHPTIFTPSTSLAKPKVIIQEKFPSRKYRQNFKKLKTRIDREQVSLKGSSSGYPFPQLELQGVMKSTKELHSRTNTSTDPVTPNKAKTVQEDVKIVLPSHPTIFTKITDLAKPNVINPENFPPRKYRKHFKRLKTGIETEQVSLNVVSSGYPLPQLQPHVFPTTSTSSIHNQVFDSPPPTQPTNPSCPTCFIANTSNAHILPWFASNPHPANPPKFKISKSVKANLVGPNSISQDISPAPHLHKNLKPTFKRKLKKTARKPTNPDGPTTILTLALTPEVKTSPNQAANKQFLVGGGGPQVIQLRLDATPFLLPFIPGVFGEWKEWIFHK